MVTATLSHSTQQPTCRVNEVLPSDEDLFLAYRETGCQDCFAKIVCRHERGLYNFLRRYLGNAELAEDVFQRTFLQVHLKRDSFQLGRKFRPWVYRIATNQAIDALRRNRRHRAASLDYAAPDSSHDGTLVDSLPAPGASPVTTMVRRETSDWSHRAVERLPQRLRHVVELVFFKGLTYREAGEALEIPLGTIKSRMGAALKQLRQQWDDCRPGGQETLAAVPA